MLLALLYQALASPYGIVVRSSNVDTLRARFYIERKRHGDPALGRLVLTPSRKSPEHLWIIKPPEEGGATFGAP